jgi:hypothetical protein
MRVFLAGKVDPLHGAWRDALMDRVWLWDAHDRTRRDHARWVLPRELDDPLEYPAWPQEPNQWVLGRHQYVGPFVVQPPTELETKYTGDFHGNTWTGQHGWMDDAERQQIVEANRRALRGADLCFCYLNTPDCFGTLVELGYAIAHRVFTFVLVNPDAEWEQDDYWYVGQSADVWSLLGDTRLDHDVGNPDEVADRAAPPASSPAEARLVRTAFHQALSDWSARPPRSPTAAQEAARQPPPRRARVDEQLIASLSSIAQWTSDPRVRNEAARMLGVLGGPVPYAPGQRG